MTTHDAAAERRKSEIEALLSERRGYEVRGLADRVAQVDAQLAERGYAEPAQRHADDKQTVAPKRRAAK